MLKELEHLIDSYVVWLKDRTSLRMLDEWAEITTPFLDRHNDFLQIYVRKENDKFILTDDSYVIQDLRSSGCDIDTKRRRELLGVILNGFGVSLEKDSLLVTATTTSFPERKHSLIQAMLAVDDLFYTAKSLVTSLFIEDVTAWFDVNDVRYSPSVKLAGRSGFDHHFNFIIPKSRKAPERIIRAINKPTRSNAESFIFSWLDTRETRPHDSLAIAIMNDTDIDIGGSVVDAFEKYEMRALRWSRREEELKQLAA